MKRVQTEHPVQWAVCTGVNCVPRREAGERGAFTDHLPCKFYVLVTLTTLSHNPRKGTSIYLAGGGHIFQTEKYYYFCRMMTEYLTETISGEGGVYVGSWFQWVQTIMVGRLW